MREKYGVHILAVTQQMNNQFVDFLSDYGIRSELILPLQKNIMNLYGERTKNINSEKADLEINLKEIQKYLDNIDEKHPVLETMDTATYQKLKRKYTEKMLEIMNALDKYKGSSSNFFDFVSCTVNLTSKLATEWASSDIHGKEHLQKLIFPE